MDWQEFAILTAKLSIVDYRSSPAMTQNIRKIGIKARYMWAFLYFSLKNVNRPSQRFTFLRYA